MTKTTTEGQSKKVKEDEEQTKRRFGFDSDEKKTETSS